MSSGQTQEEISAKIGQTQSFYSKCERGERRIDVVELRTICRAIGLPLSAFVTKLEQRVRRA